MTKCRCIVLCALLLAGCCGDITVDQWREAESLCEPHGGIAAFDSRVNERWAVADCKNGTRVQRRLKQP